MSISLLLLLDNIRFSISPCCGTVLADDEDERMIHRQKMTRRKEMGMFMVLFCFVLSRYEIYFVWKEKKKAGFDFIFISNESHHQSFMNQNKQYKLFF